MTTDRRSLLLGLTSLAAIGTANVADGTAPDTTLPKEKVLGIGGLFFRSKDPTALAAWYQHHLGIDPSPTDMKQVPWQQQAGPTIFAPFPSTTKYFGSLQQAWMVNFRVRNLDAMVAQLRGDSITVEVNAETMPNGARFARLSDPEGNPIELWQLGS